MNAFRLFETARRVAVTAAAAALLAGLSLAPSLAAVSTSNFTVTADVQSTCSIEADNLHFGGYVGTVLNATTILTTLCSDGVPYTIGLSAGTSVGATVTSRKMTSIGGDLLPYGLFQDAGHTINWGDSVGTNTKSGTGTGTGTPIIDTVYGQLPAGEFVGPGHYSDTITATLTF